MTYSIDFNVGGKSGNSIASVTSSVHTIEVFPQMIRMKTDLSLTILNICEFTDVDISGVARLIASDSSILTEAPGIGKIVHEIHHKE